jgi:hypothetical protein
MRIHVVIPPQAAGYPRRIPDEPAPVWGTRRPFRPRATGDARGRNSSKQQVSLWLFPRPDLWAIRKPASGCRSTDDWREIDFLTDA